MLVANPIYDIVFRYLMEGEQKIPQPIVATDWG